MDGIVRKKLQCPINFWYLIEGFLICCVRNNPKGRKYKNNFLLKIKVSCTRYTNITWYTVHGYFPSGWPSLPFFHRYIISTLSSIYMKSNRNFRLNLTKINRFFIEGVEKLLGKKLAFRTRELKISDDAEIFSCSDIYWKDVLPFKILG